MRRIVTLAIAGLGFVGTAWAEPVIQDEANNEDAFSERRTYGQTFRANDALLRSVTTYVTDANPEEGDDFRVIVQLYAGEGYGGALLGSWTSPPLGADFDGPVTAGFDGVRLTPGASYTLRVDSPNDRGAAQSNRHRFPDGTPISADYADGYMIGANGSPREDYDLRFRVDFLETCDVVRNDDDSLTAWCGDDAFPLASEGCTVSPNGDGSATLTCPDGTSVVVRDGEDGGSCSVTDAGSGKARITCPDGSSEVIGTQSCDSTDSAPGPVGFGLALLALAGLRRRR